ncbi:hypothetical protein, partial [Mycobacterium sp.]|uniref:hypothetical protein n=1 Tax=Mycobacterium sp. TaxID=1785 RepID=UPI003F995FC4
VGVIIELDRDRDLCPIREMITSQVIECHDDYPFPSMLGDILQSLTLPAHIADFPHFSIGF